MLTDVLSGVFFKFIRVLVQFASDVLPIDPQFFSSFVLITIRLDLAIGRQKNAKCAQNLTANCNTSGDFYGLPRFKLEVESMPNLYYHLVNRAAGEIS